MDLTTNVKLNNGIEMPRIGLGVFRMEEGGQVEQAVKTALQLGYRSIDTAYMYHNEEGVGKGIQESGVPRSEIFITSKLGNGEQGYESTKTAFYQSLKYLNADYLDLYLIHWPQGRESLESWFAMEELYKEGRIRAIGVSNFHIHHLEYILANCSVIPAVNQVEFHPWHSQPKLHEFCRRNNIQMTAWSPLMEGKALAIPEINALAMKYDKSPAQIILRWNIQKGLVTIPKSERPDRLLSNIDIFDFALSEQDMKLMAGLNRNKPMVNRRDRIIHLLQMLQNRKYDKRIIRLLSEAFKERIRNLFNFNDNKKGKVILQK